jgi:DNA-3-methyladenine glycosylase I
MRCFGDGDPLYEAYHDEEWGRPVRDERGLYERLCLEGFQAGLSWITILRKRPRFREVFAGFDPDVVAAYTERDIERLMGDAGIIRSRPKIEAAIGNARATLALRETDTPLEALVWSFAPPPRATRLASLGELPAQTDESRALAKALKAAGFKFLGPTTCYAAMQACGLVDDHIAGCPVAEAADA